MMGVLRTIKAAIYDIDSIVFIPTGETIMYKTLTATYTDKIALENVANELSSKDIPKENFFIDEDISQIKVMIPEGSENGILDILKRHGATNVH